MEPTGINLLDVLEFVGDIAFALSGALAAAARRLDVVVLCFAAVATGLIGGTLRDVLIGAPVWWLEWPVPLAGTLVVAGAVWAMGERPWSAKALDWSDAAGLSAIVAVGVARAADHGVTPLAAGVVGVLAAAAGGLVRDGLSGRAPVMLGRPLYLAAAVAGAGLFIVLRMLEVDLALAALAAAALTFGLRAGALRFGWALPGLPERD